MDLACVSRAHSAPQLVGAASMPRAVCATCSSITSRELADVLHWQLQANENGALTSLPAGQTRPVTPTTTMAEPG